ncbi:MAG: hypothetical protein EXS37_01365 [Opitutus sp.]|nr:hypothetical protein [Opitutus sp.]
MGYPSAVCPGAPDAFAMSPFTLLLGSNRHVLRRTIGLAALALVSTPMGTAAPATARYRVIREATPDGQFLVLRDETAEVEAVVAPGFGAELTSLRCTVRGRWQELLYRARDYRATDGWRGKAPILWPAIARNFPKDMKVDLNSQECAYDFRGHRYPIPISGFVRNMAWNVVRSQADDGGVIVELTLSDSAETRAQYPFSFRLEVTYRLQEGRLEMLHRVVAGANNDAVMFFSIGNHMTFRMPLVDGSDVKTIQLETPSTIEHLKDDATLPTGEQRARSFRAAARVVDLQFVPAISLGGYTGDPWLRLTDPAGLALRITHHADSLPPEPLVQFNIWGRPGDGYLSPEPVVGLQNSLNLRQGLIELSPGNAWSWRVWIDLERR